MNLIVVALEMNSCLQFRYSTLEVYARFVYHERAYTDVQFPDKLKIPSSPVLL